MPWRECYIQADSKECLLVTNDICKKPVLSYRTFANFPSLFYLYTLYYFINFFRLIKLSSSYQTFVTFPPSLFTLSTLPISRLIVRTLSAPMYFFNSTGVFGHRALVFWGGQGVAGGFLEEQQYVTLQSTNVL